MEHIFYDTNALLELQDRAFDTHFYISADTLVELENIKTSVSKDSDTKWRCRSVLRLLDGNPDCYDVIMESSFVNDRLKAMGLENTPDNRICCAAQLIQDVVFITDDLSCRLTAKNIFGLKVLGTMVDDHGIYTGYQEECLTDEDMAYFYEHLDHNIFNLITNQYLIVKNYNGGVVDRLKWDGASYVPIKIPSLKSKIFGNVKAQNNDVYQQFVLDSMCNNQITMVWGPAGTGKSYLSIGFMLAMLEKQKIDKIVIFANPVPTVNSARIGFLPGTQLDKLLDSSVGNMLAGKLGDRYMIEQLAAQNKLVILPMCDIRGFDTTGMRAAVYITEAQNLDVTLMKLALQRIGGDSICIVDGDFSTQVDQSQYAGMNNGMRRMSQVFRGHDFYGEVGLRNIYRSRIARIAEEM